MQGSDVVKAVAILCLTAIEIVNLLTLRVDGGILLAIGGLIGGLAGYSYGRRRK